MRRGTEQNQPAPPPLKFGADAHKDAQSGIVHSSRPAEIHHHLGDVRCRYVVFHLLIELDHVSQKYIAGQAQDNDLII